MGSKPASQHGVIDVLLAIATVGPLGWLLTAYCPVYMGMQLTNTGRELKDWHRAVPWQGHGSCPRITWQQMALRVHNKRCPLLPALQR